MEQTWENKISPQYLVQDLIQKQTSTTPNEHVIIQPKNKNFFDCEVNSKAQNISQMQKGEGRPQNPSNEVRHEQNSFTRTT